jgi:hypothetical protein
MTSLEPTNPMGAERRSVLPRVTKSKPEEPENWEQQIMENPWVFALRQSSGIWDNQGRLRKNKEDE